MPNPENCPPLVVVGANGRLGAALVREWRARGYNVRAIGRQELDLSRAETIHATLDDLSFGVLVNAGAMTQVDQCERDPVAAYAANAAGVAVLNDICSRKRARLIHISTDYVFDGLQKTPYGEDDPARPVSVYGLSKHAGELAALMNAPENLVVRVSWVFGPDRPSFVDQMLREAMDKSVVRAVSDKVATPTCAVEAATLLEPFLWEVPLGGILHCCNRGSCTWQEYAQWALDCAVRLGAPLKAVSVEPMVMQDLAAFVAKRPPYSAMSTAKLVHLGGRAPKFWQDAVEAYVRAILTR